MSLAALLPTVPEIRYLLARVLLRPPIGTRFIMAWSLWRRQHQAKAAAAHYRRRAKTQLYTRQARRNTAPDFFLSLGAKDAVRLL